MSIRDLLRRKRRTAEEPFGAGDVGGLFRLRRRLPTVTVTDALLEELSTILEPLAKAELDKLVKRWKEGKEAQGYQFTGEESDMLISYYKEAKKTITPTYRLLIASGGMEVVLRSARFSELRGKLGSVEKGRTKELVVEFSSRDFHMGIELKDSLILRPSMSIGGVEKSQVATLSQRIGACFARHRNLNGLVDNSVSLLFFPFVLGFLLLNAIFRCLGGVTLTGAFLFGLFLNVPLFLLLVLVMRKGFPLVEFRLTPQEKHGVHVAKLGFFLLSLAIAAFSVLTRFLS